MTVIVLHSVTGARKRVTFARKSVRLQRKRRSVKPSLHVKQPQNEMNKKVTVKRTASQSALGNITQTSAQSMSRHEEQLDAAIHRCLHALTKRHEPTEQFKTYYTRGAFMKASSTNMNAFIWVMHFLLNIYDSRGFQKRFYWPILDKATESAFRTSTVEYVNSLIERGKLVGIAKIKAHVVVLPGGVNFMKILLTIINMVLQEELRRARKGATTDGVVITKAGVAQMIDSHKRLLDAGNRIHEIVREEVAHLSKNIEKIENLITNMLIGSDLANQITYENLMQLWSGLIRSQFKQHQQHQHKALALAKEFENIITKAESKLRGNELDLPFTGEQLKDSLAKAAHADPQWDQLSQEVYDEHGKLNPMKLIQLFGLALPSVKLFFSNFRFKDQETIKFEQKELSKVVMKLNGARQLMDVLQRNLPILEDCVLSDPHGDIDSPEMEKCGNFAIKNKLFYTPPIVMDFEEHPDDAFVGNAASGRSSQRLALLNKEDVHLMNARLNKLLSTSCSQSKRARDAVLQNNKTPSSPKSTAFAVPRVARKEKLNPLTMLNRIKAQSNKQGSESKAHCINPSTHLNSTMNISTLSEISLRPELFSSTLIATPEKPNVEPAKTSKVATADAPKEVSNHLSIPPLQQKQRGVVLSPNVQSSPRLKAIYAGSTVTPKTGRSPNSLLLSGTKRTSGVTRTSFIDSDSVHTSPSGRLEPVFKQEKLVQQCEIPPLTSEQDAKDSSKPVDGDAAPTESSGYKTLGSEQSGNTMDDLTSTLLATSLESQPTIVPIYQCVEAELSGADKTNENAFKELQDQTQHVDSPEDDLFNVSDGILTDFD